jgi:hypothetical protein
MCARVLAELFSQMSVALPIPTRLMLNLAGGYGLVGIGGLGTVGLVLLSRYVQRDAVRELIMCLYLGFWVVCLSFGLVGFALPFVKLGLGALN